MGQTSSAMDVQTESQPFSIVFRKSNKVFKQTVEFYRNNSSSPLTFDLTTNRYEVKELEADRTYYYNVITQEKENFYPSPSTQYEASTTPAKTSTSVPVQCAAGPFSIRFAVEKKDLKGLNYVEIALLLHGRTVDTFRLNETCRYHNSTNLQPKTLYSYTVTTMKYGFDQPSIPHTIEYRTKACRDIHHIISKEDLARKEIAKYKDLIANLPVPEPNNYINILIIGQIGAGKSSLINSFNSAIRGIKTLLAKPGHTGESHTQVLKYYQLDCLSRVRLVDLYGLDTDNLSLHTHILNALLEGEIDTGLEKNNVHELLDSNENYKPHDSVALSKEQRRIGGVIFAITNSTLDNPHDVPTLKKFFNIIQKKEVPSIAVCTHLDGHLEQHNETFEFSKIFENPVICERSEFCSKTYSNVISPTDMFPFVNNEPDSLERDAAKDFLSVHILHLITSLASDYLMRRSLDR